MKHFFTISLLTVSLFAVPAQAADPLAGLKHDSRTPIEVTADTLEVFQQENKAVFSGHVVAIQGTIRLTSDTMTVHYRKPEGDAPAAGAGNADAIQRIDADGNVFLSTPQETASGAKGIYDVEHHEIHLDDGVVLTRDKNVLKGDHLVYKFDTGQSVLTGGNAGAKPGSGQPRVRALFVPDSNNKKTKP